MKFIRWIGSIGLLLMLSNGPQRSGISLFGGAHALASSEPNVLYENGLFKMWYTAGWETPQLNYATSADGLTWTPYAGNPVLGNGGSGYLGTFVAHTGLVKFDGTYYLYFADNNYGNWMRSASHDGIQWTTPSLILAANAYPWAVGWANSALWVKGGVWYAILESRVMTPQIWRLTLWRSTDGQHWTLQSTPFLTTLEPEQRGGASGPDLHQQDGLYYLWYHGTTSAAALPTNLYRAVSADLLHWTILNQGQPILTPSDTLPEGDQVADPSLVIADGHIRLYYEVVNNAAELSILQVLNELP